MSTHMKKLHHGMSEQHGTAGMKKRSTNESCSEGRFGRIFPQLPPLYLNPNALSQLGKKDGPMDGKADSNPTQTIPLGFIFFGQFIDHDITLDTTSRLDQVNDPNAIENFRTPALDLDCVYGSGPEASPYLYADDGVKLLVGADFAESSSDPKKYDLMRNGAGRALIGDPRNDENRIISQMQLAFVKFHNEVVDYVRAAEPNLSDGEVFEEAQEIVRWHYQWIVVHEFLPLMIGDGLVDDILGRGRQFYNPHKRSFIPIEFSAAAYRFGHSMISQRMRVNYDTQAVDLFGPELGNGFTEVQSVSQVVDWQLFFDIGSSNPQLAEQLDSKLAADLLELPFITDPRAEKSLATRNLLRGQSFLLPSGEVIAEKMGLNDSAVTARVEKIANKYNIDLDAGTPLWFYILAEAELVGRDGRPGEGLGPVGGRIVGEVLVGLLECDPTSYLGKNRNWVPTLTHHGDFTMADLLTFQSSLAKPIPIAAD